MFDMPFAAICAECEGPLLRGRWGVCLGCAQFFCGDHLVEEKGVTTCQQCVPERERRRATGVVTDADEERMAALLRADISATVGPGFDDWIREAAARSRWFNGDDLAVYSGRVVDEFQQRMHIEHVDTTWPSCSHHSNHPMWFDKGWWHCDQVGAVAPLGGLAALKAR